MYYPDDIIEEVRSRSDIVDVIGSHVKLTKKGNSYFGLCPFHNEKSPSFSVSRDKQMYYCFGCGAGGNVFTFVMEYENYSFVEAVKYLADRAGIQLPEAEQSAQQKAARDRRQQLLHINKTAATYYVYQLKGERGAYARKYFQDRQLTEKTLIHFGLGYANPYGDDLYRYLKKMKFSDDLIKASGLVRFDEKKGARDRFWNRAMFPIMDVNNKVIGFGGRVLGDGLPKYVNSPETELFDKSRNLYGLNFARTSRKKNIILCEGYMDVISMHQAGFTNAVASLGTALTSQHCALLKRYTDEAVLAYDSDGAGVKAAMRAIPLLRAAGIRTKVLHMDPCKDPDEFIKRFGTQAFQERIDQAQNSFMFEISVLERDYDLNEPDEKTRFFREAAKKLLIFDQELERRNYIEALSRQYGIPFEELNRLVNRYGLSLPEKEEAPARQAGEKPQGPDGKEGVLAAQRLILTWLCREPSIYPAVRAHLSPDDFEDPLYREICRMAYEQLERDKKVDPARIMDAFEDKEKQKLTAAAFHAPVPEKDAAAGKKALRETIIRVRRNHLDEMSRRVKDLNELQQIIKMKSELQHLNISL